MKRLTNKVRDLAISAARRHGILPSFLLGLWEVLSGFDSLALDRPNRDGAPYSFGLGKVNITGSGEGHTARQLLDPTINAEVSAKHLGHCVEVCSGDPNESVVAYVTGVDHVREHGLKGHKAFAEAVVKAVDGYTKFDVEADFPTPARTHKVKRGDNLLGLSFAYYGVTGRWEDIYNANSEIIGVDPGQVKAGTVLTIP